MPTILYNSTEFTYSLIKSKRRTISVSINTKGQVVLRAPLRVSDEKAIAFLESKMPWVIKHLNIIEKRVPINLSKKYVAGEEHYFLGNKYILDVIISDSEKVEIASDKIIIHQLASSSKNTEKVLNKWLDEEALKIFSERYKINFEKFGYNYMPRVQIKDMKRRWGSYRSTKIISLNKKLIHTPISCIDYVIIHELCHHKHMNHGKGFYGLLQKILPTYKEDEKKLKEFESLTIG